MYSVDGEFGRVRLVGSVQNSTVKKGMFSVSSAGWHKCNEKYRINRPQGCDTHIILITLSGNGVLIIDRHRYELSANTLAFLPRDVPHEYFVPTGCEWEFYWLHADGAGQVLLDGITDCQRNVCTLSGAEKYSLQMERIMELYSTESAVSQCRLSKCISDVLHNAIEELTSDRSPNNEIVLRAVKLIEAGFSRRITVNDISKELFVSPEHLIREFNRSMGCTPHAYMMQYRVFQAKNALCYSAKSIKEIAADTGFSSPSHMICVFRRLVGQTPQQYRQNNIDRVMKY